MVCLYDLMQCLGCNITNLHRERRKYQFEKQKVRFDTRLRATFAVSLPGARKIVRAFPLHFPLGVNLAIRRFGDSGGVVDTLTHEVVIDDLARGFEEHSPVCNYRLTPKHTIDLYLPTVRVAVVRGYRYDDFIKDAEHDHFIEEELDCRLFHIDPQWPLSRTAIKLQQFIAQGK